MLILVSVYRKRFQVDESEEEDVVLLIFSKQKVYNNFEVVLVFVVVNILIVLLNIFIEVLKVFVVFSKILSVLLKIFNFVFVVFIF